MRPPVLFITWQRHAGRAVEIAAALSGEAAQVHPSTPSGRAPWVLYRYAVSAVLTAVRLARSRPLSVVVTNPPVVPGLVALAYGALARRPVVLDSHPASFGAKDNAVARRLLPVHRAMARRAAAVAVTTSGWVDVVDGWGGQGLVVHEAPVTWSVRAWTPPAGRARVLFVGLYSPDEPVDLVLDAAAALPDVDLLITGDPRRAAPALRRRLAGALPPTVRLLGFLDAEEYRRAVEEADVVLVLTTEPTSVVRAGYEAVYAARPLVLSDTPALREVFPHAVHTPHTAEGLAGALREALDRDDQPTTMARALELQQARWSQQLASLRAALGLPGGTDPQTDPTRPEETRAAV